MRDIHNLMHKIGFNLFQVILCDFIFIKSFEFFRPGLDF